MKRNIVKLLVVGLMLGAILGSTISTVSAMTPSDGNCGKVGMEFISFDGWWGVYDHSAGVCTTVGNYPDMP